MTYQADIIKAIVKENHDRLFAAYAAGRSPTWSACSRTHDMICLGVWLHEELLRVGIEEVDRAIQERRFNRLSSSAEDLFELAAQLMNEAQEGKVERNRRPLRRWS